VSKLGLLVTFPEKGTKKIKKGAMIYKKQLEGLYLKDKVIIFEVDENDQIIPNLKSHIVSRVNLGIIKDIN